MLYPTIGLPQDPQKAEPSLTVAPHDEQNMEASQEPLALTERRCCFASYRVELGGSIRGLSTSTGAHGLGRPRGNERFRLSLPADRVLVVVGRDVDIRVELVSFRRRLVRRQAGNRARRRVST